MLQQCFAHERDHAVGHQAIITQSTNEQTKNNTGRKAGALLLQEPGTTS